MAEKKVKSDCEAYKSKGRKLNQASSVGKPEKEMLSDGTKNYADGNDGSKSPASAPENKHKLC